MDIVKRILLLSALMLLAAASMASQARAQQACYAFSIPFQTERYKLDIKKHSPLTTKREEVAFTHLPQVAYSVHGKHVGTCGLNQLGQPTVRPVVGTLITTKPVGQPLQSRLGLETYTSTGPIPIVPGSYQVGGLLFCKDVEVSCKAGLAPGFPPPVWDCSGQNKFNVEYQFQLVLVDPTVDPLCSIFEDGGGGVICDQPTTGCDLIVP